MGRDEVETVRERIREAQREQALAVVQASYREGLEQLERGAPNPWRST